MTDMTFFVVGDPRGKQRPRTIRRGGRTITYTPQETLDYERTIREAFLLAFSRDQLPLKGAIIIDVVAIFSRTKALLNTYADGSYKYGTERLLHTVKPDEDNIRKCVSDAIGEYIEGGDSRVVGGTTLKLYGTPYESSGTIVRVRTADCYETLDDLLNGFGLDWTKQQ